MTTTHCPSPVDEMIAYLARHRAEIEALRSGRVQFDWSSNADVKAQITRFDRLRRAPD